MLPHPFGPLTLCILPFVAFFCLVPFPQPPPFSPRHLPSYLPLPHFIVLAHRPE